MKTPSALISASGHDLLFDDRSCLEAALGKDALKVSSINANCDCSSYYSTEDDESVNPRQVTTSAVSTH